MSPKNLDFTKEKKGFSRHKNAGFFHPGSDQQFLRIAEKQSASGVGSLGRQVHQWDEVLADGSEKGKFTKKCG